MNSWDPFGLYHCAAIEDNLEWNDCKGEDYELDDLMMSLDAQRLSQVSAGRCMASAGHLSGRLVLDASFVKAAGKAVLAGGRFALSTLSNFFSSSLGGPATEPVMAHAAALVGTTQAAGIDYVQSVPVSVVGDHASGSGAGLSSLVPFLGTTGRADAVGQNCALR